MDSDSKTKWMFYCLLIIFAFSTCYLYVNDPCLLEIISEEDGILETTTAIFYFVAFLILIYIFNKKSSKNLWYLIFAITFLVIAGEEISWGQRLLGFSSTELFKTINVQREFSFHNIKGIHENIRGVAVFVIVIICGVVPITGKFMNCMRNFYRRIKLPICPLWLLSVFIMGIAFMVFPRLLLHKIIFEMDEIGEFYLAIGFLIFSTSELKKYISRVS